MRTIDIYRSFHVLEHLGIAVYDRYLAILLLLSSLLFLFLFGHNLVKFLLTSRIDIRMLPLDH